MAKSVSGMALSELETFSSATFNELIVELSVLDWNAPRRPRRLATSWIACVDDVLGERGVAAVDGGSFARTEVGQTVDGAVGDELADAAGVDVAETDRGGIGGIDLGTEAEGRAAAGDAEGLGLADGD